MSKPTLPTLPTGTAAMLRHCVPVVLWAQNLPADAPARAHETAKQVMECLEGILYGHTPAARENCRFALWVCQSQYDNGILLPESARVEYAQWRARRGIIHSTNA